MEFQLLLLQGFVATVISIIIGFIWYSESAFGRSWWKLTFPGVPFGDKCAFKDTSSLPWLSLAAMITYSAFLTVALNVLYPFVKSNGTMIPLSFSLFVSGLMAAVNYNHCVFSNKPFALFLINSGFDVIQVAACCYAIYFLLPA